MRVSIDTEMSSNVVYAIVKAGGRQEKVSVGSVVVVDKLDGEVGDPVELEPLMLVDGTRQGHRQKLTRLKVTGIE